MPRVQPTHGLSRREIPQRSRRWAGASADALYRAGIRPDHISVLSVLLAFGAGALFAASAASPARPALLIAGAVLLPLRLACNMLDGMLAVEKRLASPTGDLYNEVPDRLADVFALAGAGYAVRGVLTAGTLDVGVALGWAAAVLAVLTAYVRSLGAANGVGNFFAGPMAKPARMWVLAGAAALSAAEGAVGVPAGTCLIAALAVIAAGSGLTAIRRLRLVAAALRAADGGR